MRRADVGLRPATASDLPFLRDLHASTRAFEGSVAGWPEAAWAGFVDRQFALQHRDFLARHPTGDFLVVTRLGVSIGRLYVDRGRDPWRLIDIALLPSERGRGFGAAILRMLQACAVEAGASAVDLHVARSNVRAARLYGTLGFREALSASGTHRRLSWPAPLS